MKTPRAQSPPEVQRSSIGTVSSPTTVFSDEKVFPMPVQSVAPDNVATPASCESVYEVYSYRYVVLLSYIFIRFTSGAVYGLFIPFSTIMRKVYGIKHVFIVFTGYTFNALSPLVNLLYANKIILSYGTKMAVIFAFITRLACIRHSGHDRMFVDTCFVKLLDLCNKHCKLNRSAYRSLDCKHNSKIDV